MKEHLVIKLRENARALLLEAPFWGDFIGSKERTVEALQPEFDALMAERRLPFWVTHEYKAKGAGWSAEEIAAGLNRIYRVVLQEDSQVPEELLERVRLIPDFESVRAIRIGASRLPRPVVLSEEFRVDTSRNSIYLPQAHLLTKGLPEIKIAVLDTGVNLSHPELEGKIAAQADFVDIDGLHTSEFVGDATGFDDIPEDEVGHGTHVSGIIAGAGKRMPTGVAPNCRLLPVRVLASMKAGDRVVGAGLVDNINVGIKWAVDQGADVINMSLGIRHEGGGLPHEEVIRYALSRGVSVVAASGNDGTDEKYYPGALPGVIAVGAMDSEGAVASFSSYGAPVSLIGPGSNVYSAYAREGYAFASGTSQAAPFVSGAIALLKAYARKSGATLGDAEVKQILKETADRMDQRLRHPKSGYGRLNLIDALKYLKYQLGGRLAMAA